MKLIDEIRQCKVCEKDLPLGANPVVSFSNSSKIIIVGQAPGTKVHQSSIPWDDASGDRLRTWLGVSKDQFYDPSIFAIVPMGFCYPGKGKAGDLPPRPECAPLWMPRVLKKIENPSTILLIGQYSQAYFLKNRRKKTLTDTVRNWREYLPEYIVFPHPSPRNNIWLKRNPWFELELLPAMRDLLA